MRLLAKCSMATLAARAKDAFSLKDFHSRALGPGPMGLDPLRQELARP